VPHNAATLGTGPAGGSVRGVYDLCQRAPSAQGTLIAAYGGARLGATSRATASARE
jgi:hypothetical protein